MIDQACENGRVRKEVEKLYIDYLNYATVA